MSTGSALPSALRVSLDTYRSALGRAAWIVIGLATLGFVLVNCVGLADPGLEYDELLFVNGALGVPHAYHDFIYREAFGVPTMLMPYIGALKAWLYAPIFAVFGVSVDSVRIPAVLMGGAALLLFAWLARRLLGLWPAAALAVLLATDPAFGAMSRTDWGPIVLSAALRAAALLAYFAFLQRGSVRYLWLAVLALSLGLFNKLDFAWFVVALAVAALVVHHGELLEALRRRRAAVGAPILALIGVGLATLFGLIIPADELPTTAPRLSLSARITEVEHLFRGTFDGGAVYENMTGEALPHTTLIGSLTPAVLILAALVAVWYVLRGRRSPHEELRQAARLTAFFLVLFLVLAVGIVATRQATGPWHVMLLWPLPSLLAICLLVVAVRLPAPTLARVAASVVAVALVALLVSQVRASVGYLRAYRSDRSWTSPWSTEIYAAARSVSRAAPGVQSVITTDWGLGTEMYALGDEALRARFGDEWSAFMSPTASPATLEHDWFQGRSVIVVYHAQGAQIMAPTTARVLAILAARRGHVRPVYAGRQIEADEVLP